MHLTRLSTEGLGPRHGEVRRAHHMLNAALVAGDKSEEGSNFRPRGLATNILPLSRL